jgi:hypothetical protein
MERNYLFLSAYRIVQFELSHKYMKQKDKISLYIIHYHKTNKNKLTFFSADNDTIL